MGQPASPPETVGASPINADEVNNLIGLHMRQFCTVVETIGHDQDWLAGADLKVDPYNFSPDQETLIKSAVNGLDTALAAIDTTFINRLTGLFP